MVDATGNLRSIEVALRLAVRVALGYSWLDAAGAPNRDLLRDRQVEESKRRDGAVVSEDLLDYTETYHLITLIEKNWEKFKPVFKDKARTSVFLGVVLDVRNSIAHSRELLPFEEKLLAGISGQIRNQVALYRGSNDQSSIYYPLIEFARDSFGREALRRGAEPRFEKVRVNVGDTVEFSGKAFNARGNPVRWMAGFARNESIIRGYEPRFTQVAVGDDVTFSYEFKEVDVGETNWMNIYIVGDDLYTRNHGDTISIAHDDAVHLPFSVNPPFQRSSGNRRHPSG